SGGNAEVTLRLGGAALASLGVRVRAETVPMPPRTTRANTPPAVTRRSCRNRTSQTKRREAPHGYGLLAQEPPFLAALAREEVDAVHEPDPVAARAHHQRVRARAVGEVPDATE